MQSYRRFFFYVFFIDLQLIIDFDYAVLLNRNVNCHVSVD